MIYDFDNIINRRDPLSVKWTYFPPDVLPLWVADMDFPVSEAITQALHARIDREIFGYQIDSPSLRQVLVERLATRHHMTITPDCITFLPGLVGGLNLIVRAFTEPDAAILVQTPAYPPFLSAPINHGRTLITAPLKVVEGDHTLRYEIDFDALEAAITPETKMFVLCNPHNPTGRVYTRAELEQIAALVIKHDLLLVSDEIHCDLVFAPHQHISIASLSPEIAARTITLIAPSKTFNVPGLACSMAIIPNADMRTKLFTAAFSNGIFANTMGLAAAEGAYRGGQAWLDQLLPYLQSNRDYLVERITQEFPQARISIPEGTYLMWVDFGAYALENGATKFFMEQAKVGFSNGHEFGGDAYQDYIRINFGCPRATLVEALDRMKAAAHFSAQ